MKRIKQISILALALVLTMLFDIPVFAGLTSAEVPCYTVDGELNTTDWYDPNDELVIRDNTLIMSKESTGDTRVISKATAVADTTYEDMVTATGKIRFTSFPKGERFIIAFGLDNIESYCEEPNNVEIHLTNEGSMKASLIAYDENGEEKVLVKEKSCPSGILDFEAVVTSKAQLRFKVNGTKVLETKLPSSGEGHVGLLQSGSIGAEISDFKAVFVSYDRPENTNYTETFEEGIYNKNLFTTAYYGSTRAPSCLAVEEYEGSNVLMFRNTGRCYFGTKQKFSNFELTFDIPFFSRETVKDKERNVIMEPCDTACVSIGDVAQDFNGWQFTTSTDLIHFTQSSVWTYNHEPHLFNVKYDDMGFFDKASNEGFSVKMTMVDGDFTLALKSLKAKEFKVIATAHYDNFRTGYIKIWSTGNSNMAIDNFAIKNLDQKPNLIETEFVSAKIEVKDFDYQKQELVFKETKEEAKEKPVTFEWWMVFAGTAAVSVFMMGGAVIVRTVKNKRQKEEKECVEE